MKNIKVHFKKIMKSISYTILILLLGITMAFAKLTTTEIVKEYADSVVTIVALDENDQPIALGSGFFINKDGEIATNHHVLEKGVKAIIKTSQGKEGKILEIIKDDPNIDILVAKTTLKNVRPIPLGDSDSAVVGEDIIAIGNPEGLERTVSKGIISGMRVIDLPAIGSFTPIINIIQITAPISPGSSGGPILDSKGKVIAIATAYLETGQNLNFAVPINYLKTLKLTSLRLGSLPKSILKGESQSSDKDSDVRVQDNGWIRIKDVFVKNVTEAEVFDISKDDPKYKEYNSRKHKMLYVKIMFLRTCKATEKESPLDKAIKEGQPDKEVGKAFGESIMNPEYWPKFQCDYRTKIFVSFYSSEGLEIETVGKYIAAKKDEEVLSGEMRATFLSDIPENATSWKVWVPK